MGGGLVLGSALGNLAERIFEATEKCPTSPSIRLADLQPGRRLRDGGHRHHDRLPPLWPPRAPARPAATWYKPTSEAEAEAEAEADAPAEAEAGQSSADGDVVTLDVPPSPTGIRVDERLQAWPTSPRSAAAGLVSAGRVLIDGVPALSGKDVL